MARVGRNAWWGLGLWLAVAVPSILQIRYPELLTIGRRDPARWDEPWRLVTSMFLQDGGVLGTVSNLVLLAAVLVALRRRPGRLVVALFVVGGVVGNLLTLAIWPSTGAGNSMATLFLFAALVDSRVARLALVVAAVALLLAHDHHGLAITAGLLVALVGTARGGRRR